jgi:hypothetical protein
VEVHIMVIVERGEKAVSLYTRADLARLLGVSYSNVHTRITVARSLPAPVTTHGRRPYYDEAQLRKIVGAELRRKKLIEQARHVYD